jgi:hypothetical protein
MRRIQRLARELVAPDSNRPAWQNKKLKCCVRFVEWEDLVRKLSIKTSQSRLQVTALNSMDLKITKNSYT